MDKDLKKLALKIEKLKLEKLIALQNQGDIIIKNNIKDTHTIELLLDNILDLCDMNDGTILFNKLCDYYKCIDINGATDYLNIYKEIYKEK